MKDFLYLQGKYIQGFYENLALLLKWIQAIRREKMKIYAVCPGVNHEDIAQNLNL